MFGIRTVRDARSSLFQSIVDHVLMRRAPDRSRPTLADPHAHAATIAAEHLAAGAEPPADAPDAVKQLDGGEGAWSCIKRMADIFLARTTGQTARAAQLEADFKDSPCDPDWIEAFDHYLGYFGLSGDKRAVPYIPCTRMSDFVLDTLPANATVLLIGDWATGTDVARALMVEAKRHAPDLLIHIGDIYYSGTDRETRANFLDVLNDVFDRSGGELPVYTLAGNHDIYSGGVGYYQLLPQLNPSPPFSSQDAQPASFFCLRNASRTFQLLAMDTGLHDGDPFTVASDVTWLEPAEAAWHLDKIASFHADGGRTILFSHHPLFSAFSPIGRSEERPPAAQAVNPKLLATFEEALAANQVLAWFWGHEHNLCIYEPYGPLARGRCIGHGAVPVSSAENPYTPSPKIANPPALVRDPATGNSLQLPLDETGVFRHGYVVLRLDDTAGTAEAAYYLAGAPDTPFYRETLR